MQNQEITEKVVDDETMTCNPSVDEGEQDPTIASTISSPRYSSYASIASNTKDCFEPFAAESEGAGALDAEPDFEKPIRQSFQKQDRVPWADASSDSDSSPSTPRADPPSRTPTVSTAISELGTDCGVNSVTARSVEGLSEESLALGGATTVMLKNIPNRYTQRMFMAELNRAGFLGHYDFLHFPIDPRTLVNRGFAFVNLDSSETARRFFDKFNLRKLRRFEAEQAVEIVAAKVQGFYSNAEHYLSSAAKFQQKSGDPDSRRRRGPQSKPLFLRPLPADLEARYLPDLADEEESVAEPPARQAQHKALAQPKFCPFCGNNRQADHAFCAFCGKRFPTPAAALQAPPQPPSLQPMCAVHPVPAVHAVPMSWGMIQALPLPVMFPGVRCYPTAGMGAL